MTMMAAHPYSSYRLYGPTLHKEEGRRYVFLVDPQSKARTTLSYARYLLSVHLGRTLGANEHVDHIDNNPLNDVIHNLQILTPEENLKKQAATKGVKTAVLRCPNCCKEFERRANQTHLGGKPGTYTACSRSCAGAFSVALKKHGKQVPEDHVVRIYQRFSAVS